MFFKFAFFIFVNLIFLANCKLRFNENATRVTISGGSSGACVATQYAVAYSSQVGGLGAFAGVPYYCAQDLTVDGVLSCITTLIDIDTLVKYTGEFASQGKIDPVSNMKPLRVFLFSGTLDTVVPTRDVIKTGDYFARYVLDPANQIYFENNISAEHAWVTNDYGNECYILWEPFINNCHYDFPKAVLEFLYADYGSLNPRMENYPYNNVIGINQQLFIPAGKTAAQISLQDIAYIYKPTNCEIHPLSSHCVLHILFHGCLQNLDTFYIHDGTDRFNDTLVRHAGFNQWAETNNIVVLYPQAKASVVPLNPEGCWDWWGYTGENYAWNTSWQMKTVNNMQQWILGN